MIIGKNISLKFAFDFLLDKHLQKKKIHSRVVKKDS